MTENKQVRAGNAWPSSGMLLVCAALVAAGYGVAVLRGPSPAQEVRVLLVPAPTPTEETAPSAE